jgi:6-phosphogluconolactonase
VAVDQAGHWLYVANYNSGSMAAIPIRADGGLGEGGGSMQHGGSSVNPQRQRGPHAHSANLAPDGRFLLAADLGLDQILVYRLDGGKGPFTPNDPPFAKVAPGSGPRHMAFSRDGRFAYAVNEMLATVTAFRYDAARGRLEELQTVSMTAADYTGAKSGAEIAVHPDGRFLYASNRGDSTIALFRIDPAKGTLTAVERTPSGGKTPRNFAIDPTGTWLFAANQDSGNVVLFRIDPASGRLSASGKTIDVASPVCVVFAKP